jgi:hypothetical protein
MSSEKKIYLVAIAVIAFGLGNSQIRKHMDWFERLSGRVGCVASGVSEGAMDGENRFADLAEGVFSRGPDRIGRDQTALARVQVKMACVQARMAQRQAQMVRQQAVKARVVTLHEVQRTVTIERQKAMRNISNQTTPSTDDTI